MQRRRAEVLALLGVRPWFPQTRRPSANPNPFASNDSICGTARSSRRPEFGKALSGRWR